MRVELLGPVRVDGDVDALSPRDRVVLTVLALERDGPVSVDRIADALWGEAPPASAAKVVHGCISRLRRRLGAEAIVTVPGGYRLDLGADEVDVRRFERLVAHARELLVLDEADRAAWELDAALSLWGGRPLTAVEDWDEGRTERQRVLALHDDAEELRVDALLRAGRAHEALPTAVALVQEQPLREARWVLLARAQYQCGRQAEALTTLERARERLARELGLDPGPALESLQRRILRHDASLAVAAEPSGDDGGCPYPGLRPFGQHDSDDFFGREEEVDDCMRRLGRDGVVVVAGPSGSGKSSLVRAGIAARCRVEGRSFGVVVATARLADELSTEAPRPDVLVIDQLEMLLGTDVTEAERRAALAAIAEHTLRGDLVLVVRSDRLGELADGPVAGVVEGHLLLLRPLGAAALRRAITAPAARNGLHLEPGLVDLLLAEVEREPGALPLLSHALRRTWERREGRTLTVAGYRAVGGIRDAIARTADAVHADLDAAGRTRLRELLLRMVTRTSDGAVVAAAIGADSIDDPVAAGVVERLVAARLLTVDGDRIELAHEALVRAWPRLGVWLDEDVAGQRVLRHLTVAAQEWDARGRPDSELYRGVRLDEAVTWRDQAQPHLTPVEADFLDAAVARCRREAEERARRVARTDRLNRRLQRRLRGIAAAAVVAVVAGVVAAGAAARARQDSLAADARRVGSQALLTDRADTAVLLAAGAVALDDSPDTRASLLTALGRSPALTAVVVPAGGGALSGVAVDPTGSTVAVEQAGIGVRFLDLSTGAEQGRIAELDGPIGMADTSAGATAFHPGGGPVAHGLGGFDVLAAPVQDTPGHLQLWLLDPVTFERGQALTIDRAHADEELLPVDLAWNADGTVLAALLHRYVPPAYRPTAALLAVWPRDATRPTVVTDELATSTRSLAWSAGGRRILTATDTTLLGAEASPRTTVWDARSLAPVAVFDGAGHPIAVSPDGRTVAAVSLDTGRPERVVLLDATSGRETGRLDRHDGPVRAVAFAPDGTTVASAGGHVVHLSDAGSGRLVEQLTGHTGEVTDLAFTPDGRRLVTVGADGAALTWDLTGRQRLLRVLARAEQPPVLRPVTLLPVHASIDPAGRAVAYVGAMVRDVFGDVVAGVQFLDVATNRLSAPRMVGKNVWQTVVWPSDGRPLTVDSYGERGVWDPETGDPVQRDHLWAIGSLVGLVDDELVVLHTRASAVVRLDPDARGTDTRLGQVSAVEDAGDVRFSSFSMRPVATSSAGPRAAVFAGARAEDPVDDLRRNVGETGSFGSLPPGDHVVVIELDDLDRARVLPLGFDGAAAAFDPAGERLVVAGRLGEVALVTLTGERVSAPVVAHEGPVTSAVWVDGGRIAATGGEDGRVALWDGATGQSLGSLQVARPGRAAAVGGRADGQEVLVATVDGELFALDTRLDTWVATACAVAGRSLTADEWSAVAGDRPVPDVCATR